MNQYTPTRTASGTRRAREVVGDHVLRLRRCTRAFELEDFAVVHGLNAPDDFARYVSALRAIAGVDLAAFRALHFAQRQMDPAFVARANHGPRVRLWCAGTVPRFTVARPGAAVLWRDNHPPAHAVTTEAQAAQSAALQAIWLAGRVLGQSGWDAGTLRLTVERSHGIALVELHRAALAVNLLLELATDPIDNPASRKTGTRTVHWHHSDPTALLDLVELPKKLP
ncbi:hypothetical protein [Nocardia noduli]|uniref:hypothetical protein n=1 Tax=Nocardia noduli TaxID=2815722 RepID=UPI001C20FF44|nr:hypothetical protein [Nocardia noduli]